MFTIVGDLLHIQRIRSKSTTVRNSSREELHRNGWVVGKDYLVEVSGVAP